METARYMVHPCRLDLHENAPKITKKWPKIMHFSNTFKSTVVFLIFATAVRDCRVSNDHNCFDPVRLVQTLHTLQTATNSIIVWLRFMLFTFSVARIDKTSKQKHLEA